MRWRDYYRRWLSVALGHSWTVTDTAAGVLGLAVPAVTGLISDRFPMADLTWQIPLAAFGALFVTRLVLAPWWIHQEQEKSHADAVAQLRQELMAKLDSIAAERDASAASLAEMCAVASAKPATAGDTAEAFRRASRSIQDLLNSQPLDLGWEEWLGYTRRLAALILRPSYAGELEPRIRNARAPDPRMQPRFTLQACVEFLNGWAVKVSDTYVNPDCTLEALKALTATQPK